MTKKKSTTQELLEKYLDSFNQLTNGSSTQLPEWTWQYRGGSMPFHLGVSVMIHGNEVGPLEGLLDIIEALKLGKLNFPGTFTCFIGNVPASRLNQRAVDEDLNRVFSSDLLSTHTNRVERQRATALLPLLDQFDLYVDFHQTILPVVHPFYICPWQIDGWHWMRIMGGATQWVTRNPNIGGGGLACADEYVRQKGKPSVALELGALGFRPDVRAAVWRTLSHIFNAVHSIRTGSILSDIAQSKPDLKFYETRYRCVFNDPMMTLKSGFKNFQSVEAGTPLSPENKPMITAPISGALLFPKYPVRDHNGMALDPVPKELFRIISPLDQHPLEMWGNV